MTGRCQFICFVAVCLILGDGCKRANTPSERMDAAIGPQESSLDPASNADQGPLPVTESDFVLTSNDGSTIDLLKDMRVDLDRVLGPPIDSYKSSLPPEASRQANIIYIISVNLLYDGLIANYDENRNGGHLTSLEVFSDRFSTMRGIRIGDSILMVRKAYALRRGDLEHDLQKVGDAGSHMSTVYPKFAGSHKLGFEYRKYIYIHLGATPSSDAYGKDEDGIWRFLGIYFYFNGEDKVSHMTLVHE